MAKQDDDQKYIVCNADESEPGTFKDRLILEGDPHAVLESMAIAGYAVGADQGWIYIRGEYEQAKERLEHAIEQAAEYGCWAIISWKAASPSISTCTREPGHTSAVRRRPCWKASRASVASPASDPPTHRSRVSSAPHGSQQRGDAGQRTPIIRNGADWFRAIGTERCPGTKVYTMLGDVNITGLVEAPMGTTLREIIEIYGGGMKDGKAFKCAQTGGASGSFIPPEMLDTPMDYPNLREKGAALGSGALLVCGDDTCIVDLAYVLERFFVSESCGKCTPCRVGTSQMLESLERLRRGYGTSGGSGSTGRGCHLRSVASFCGLGQAAPVPIITGLRYFRDEFEAHIHGECPTECMSHA